MMSAISSVMNAEHWCLCRLQVEVTHQGMKKRKYRVKGLLQAANQYRFHVEEEGRDMTVAEYFEMKYKIR